MKKVIIAASLLAFGASTPVLAQGIETVVISATKRQQTLQEVPISVAVVSGKLLEDSGARQFNDLQTTVPNLQIDHTNGIVFIDHIKDEKDSFYTLDEKGELQSLDYDEHIKNNSILW